MTAVVCVIVTALGWPTVSAASGDGSRVTTRSTSRRTESRPAVHGRKVAFQPGVVINWGERQVELAGKIALREGPLELFACATDLYGGDKTHESIVLLRARPLHVFQALGLIGLEPGRPARYDVANQKVIPATGQAVEVRVRWRANGKQREVDASDWMRLIDKPDEPLEPLPWVFAGSAPRPEGGILADEDGTVITTVDFDGSIVTLSTHHPRDYSQLWIEARPEAIPPMDTPCTVIVRAAGLRLVMDRFGRLFCRGERLDEAGLAGLVRNHLERMPGGAIDVEVAPTALRADVERLRSRLKALGVGPDRVRINRGPASAFPKDDPQAGRAFLRDQLPLQRSLLDSVAEERQRLTSQLSSRHAALGQRVSAVAEYVARLRQGLSELVGASTQPTNATPDARPTGGGSVTPGLR